MVFVKQSNEVLRDPIFKRLLAEKISYEEEHNDKIKAGRVASIDFRIELFLQAWEEFNQKKIRNPIETGSINVTTTQVEKGVEREQKTPLREVFFPLIASGGFLPKNGPFQIGGKGMDRLPDNILILLPGIGTTSSHAKSLMQIVSRFAQAKHPSIAALDNGKKSLTLPLALDTTINGFALGAPNFFSSPEISVEMIEHATLIISALFPEINVFVAGRSQGGLQALEYASRYKTAQGVFALNPSIPHKVSYDFTVTAYKNEAFMEELDMGEISLIPEIWESYVQETPSFDFHKRAPRIPVKILLGEQDVSYGSKESFPDQHQSYRNDLITFQKLHSEMVEIKSWEDGTHDMWSTIKRRHVFDSVIEFMSQSMLSGMLND